MESSPDVLQVDLADLVVPKQVSVVQELDLGKLSVTLQAIVDAVNSRAASGQQDDAPTKGDFDALQKELEKLRQDVDGKDTEIKELKAEQEKLTEQLGDKIGKGDLDPKGVLEEIKKQDERLSKLDGGGGDGDGASGGAAGAANAKQGLAPRVDEMSAELKALQAAVKAAKDAAEDAAARAALALKSAGGGPALQPSVAPSSEADSGASAAAAATAPPAGQGSPAATVARVEGLALDLDVLAKKQKDLEGRLAKHEAVQDTKLRGVLEAQEALRKASREAANAAEDAKSAGDTTGKRLGEAESQLGALRAAVEALNNGEKIELPAPVAAPAPVDLGPLERRVSQKADADNLTAAEKRLEKLEAAVREAREAADAAEGRGSDADKEMRELKASLSRLEEAQQQQQHQQGGSSGQGGGAPGSVMGVGDSAAGNEGTQHHHHHHESDRSHTADSSSNNNNSTKELSEIRSELRELKSTMETLLEKAQGAAKGGDLSDLAAEVEALRKVLSGKASQADVDALLAGGAFSGAAATGGAAGGGGGGGEAAAAGGGAAAAEVDPSSATTESLAVTINEMKLQLNSLQGFLSVLQGRMDGKASTDDVDSLRRGHQSISEKIVTIENRLDEVNKVSNATKELTKQVSSIEKRLSAVEARPVPAGGLQQGAAPGADSNHAAAAAATNGQGNAGAAGAAGAMDGKGIGALEERLRQAMEDIAELRSMMSEVTAMRSAVSGAEQLRGEVDSGMASLREEVTAMHGSLAAKADKAELDALLEAGLPAGGGAAADSGGANAASSGLSESADTKDIVALLNDLAGRVASLSATQKVLQERLSGKADAAALDAKANRDSVAKLEAALATKASQDALDAIRDELGRLKAQMGGAQQHHSQSQQALPSASGGLSAEHLATKADRSELRELQNALGSLAAQIGAGVPALGTYGAAASAPHPSSGIAAENGTQGSTNAGPNGAGAGNGVASLGGSNNSNSNAGLAHRLAALEGDVGRLASALEIVAHAANILAVGEAHAMTPISGPTNYTGPVAGGAGAGAGGGGGANQNAHHGSEGNHHHAPHGAAANGLDWLGGAGAEGNGNGNSGGAASASGFLAGTGLASAKNGVVFGKDGVPRGAVDKLRDMHATSFYNRKMDWFDPEWLQDLARRVGDVESSVRALKKANNSKPATSGSEMPGRSAGGHKDYDKMIMKLGRDIANLRKQLGDMAAGGAGGGMMGGGGGLTRVPDGDHAMLSSKPLLGYRCMACDRPLEKLDEKPGPYVPTNQMPVNVAPYERRGIGQPVGHDSPPKPMHQPVTSQEIAASRASRAGADGRGPQNWYQDVHGKPASYLPSHDVGPVLPRGGWRGNETGAPVQAGRGGYQQVDKLPSLMAESSRDGYSGGQQPQQLGGMPSEGSLPPIGQ